VLTVYITLYKFVDTQAISALENTDVPQCGKFYDCTDIVLRLNISRQILGPSHVQMTSATNGTMSFWGGGVVLLELYLEFETRVAKSCKTKALDTRGKKGGIQVADRLGD